MARPKRAAAASALEAIGKVAAEQVALGDHVLNDDKDKDDDVDMIDLDEDSGEDISDFDEADKEILDLAEMDEDEDLNRSNGSNVKSKRSSTRKAGETRGRKPKGYTGPTKTTATKTKIKSKTPEVLTVYDEEFFQKLDVEFANENTLASKDPWVTGYRSVENKFIHYHGLSDASTKQLELAFKFSETHGYLWNNSISLSEKLFKLPPAPLIPDFITKSMDQRQFDTLISLDNKINFNINDHKSEDPLMPFNSVAYPENTNFRKGSVVNTGGIPLATTWLPCEDSEIDSNYLFVSVIKHQKSTVIPELSYSSFNSFASCLQIFEVNKAGNCELIKSIFFDCGAIITMKWSYSSGKDSLLACLFTDGSVKVFKFTKHFLASNTSYMQITEASAVVTIPGMESKLSAIEWTSEQTIVVGTNEGYLAEFDISSPGVPFYVIKASSTSGIINIVSTFSDYILTGKASTQKTVLISTGDSHSYFVDLSVLRYTYVLAFATRTPMFNYSYIPLMGAFFLQDETYAPKTFYMRDPATFYSHPCDETATSTCIGTSIYSPLALIAFSNGKLKLMNLTRKELLVKISPNYTSTLTILQLERSDVEDGYRLNMEYHLHSSGKGGKYAVELSNSGICATSISFNETPGSTSWYAAGFTCGLVVVEKLQSGHLK